jgi:hypothetical protein
VPECPAILLRMKTDSSRQRQRLHWWTGAAAVLVAVSLASCSSSGSSSTTTSTTSVLKTSAKLTITPVSPAGLLPAITHVTGTIPTNKLAFTYVRDRHDSSWVLFQVKPLPAYASSVQGGYGYGHLVSGAWQLAGPASSDVGCTASGQQIVVPAAVFHQFGQKDPC